jgi:hypothetical protein
MPFKNPVVSRIGKINRSRFHRIFFIINGIFSEHILDKKGTKIIRFERRRGIGSLFESVLQVMDSESR